MTEDQEPSGSTKRLSDDDFKEACRLYENDVMGLGQIADKFSISRQALSKRFRDNDIKRGSKVNGPAVQPPAPEPDRYSALRPEWIEETRTQGYKALKQAQVLARKTVADAVKAGKPLETIDGDLKAIQRFNKILCDNLDTVMRLLEADSFINDEDLPSLSIEDLTDEEILQHHKTTGAMPEDATLDDLATEDLEFPE